jgi:ketosteroid isomerase-like protein
VAADERVDLVRRAYEAWNAGGPGALAPFMADGVELYDAPELPDAGSWSGRDAVLARLDEVAAAVGSGSGELEGFRRHRDNVLVTLAWQREGDEAGEASLGRVFHVVQVADGRIARISVFLDEAAALRAAGLPE